MNAVWPDPKDTNEVGWPVSEAGWDAYLEDLERRIALLRQEGADSRAAELQVFATLHRYDANRRRGQAA